MEKRILLGNEAIVQGALEAGVDFVSTYPGTPASEIGNIFSGIAKKHNIYFEFSTNEKVALEAAIGASFSGLKTLVAMKSFGVNVCSDALLPLLYTGTKGPMVIVVADDPSCWSSGQSEQNTRAYAYLAHIPMLEPSDAQEAKDFTKLGFEISERFKIPVILRTTTRVAHQRMPVQTNSKFKIQNPKQIQNPKSKIGKFIKDTHQFVTMPPRVLEMKAELLEKIEKIRQFAEKSPQNKAEGRPTSFRLGIIASGISYLHTLEALQELKLNLPVLKLGFFYPLPEKIIKNFIKNLKKVLVVEELEPYLEKEIKILAKEINPELKVFGKDCLPITGELNTQIVLLALAKVSGRKYKLPRIPSLDLAKRFPRLCVGCPYWFVFSAIKKAAPKETVFGGDIGCYMLAGFPPHNIQDYLFCMGSSIGIGHGIKKAINPPKFSERKLGRASQKLIALIGDSTFFHAGIPALINTVFNKSDPLIIIMDNRITAMTGFQPHPGMGRTGMGDKTYEIKIEDIVRACGVKNIKVIDPINTAELTKTIKEFLNKKEVSVIVARRMCAYLARKQDEKK